jgi:hypothetical protein
MVTATYIPPGKATDEIRVEVRLNTHSVDLGRYKLEDLAFLRFDGARKSGLLALPSREVAIMSPTFSGLPGLSRRGPERWPLSSERRRYRPTDADVEAAARIIGCGWHLQTVGSGEEKDHGSGSGMRDGGQGRWRRSGVRLSGEQYSFCSTHCLHAFQENPSAFIGTDTGEKPGSKRTSIASGIAGAGALVFIFFGIVTLSNGFLASALDEFRRIWYWIALLAGGFGLQLALFVYLRSVVRGKMAGATAELAASGTISTGSMVACCSHALVNLLPISAYRPQPPSWPGIRFHYCCWVWSPTWWG